MMCSTRPSSQQPSFRQQAGLTLVELMLALAIGLMLISIVIGVLVSGKKNQQLQQAYEELQNNGRHAVSFLAQEIRRAGFDSDGRFAYAPLQNPSSDVIRLGYANMLDCSGATGNIYVGYRLSNNELVCDGDQDPAQSMTSELEAFAALYGEDTGSATSATDGRYDRNVDVYRTASTVANWKRVHAVQIAIVLRSAEEVLEEVSTATYTLFPGYTAYDPADDRHLRKVFRTTVYLRNRE
jgi:prepilin-type N-terminal cleavage/methylation domain-containing protein